MQYQTGTVTVSSGSATVTGAGTAWLAEISAGDAFIVVGDNVTYTVASVASNTSLNLSAPYGGASLSGILYAITRDFTSLGMPEFSPGDQGTAAMLTRAMRIINDKLVDLGA